ncbi:hypothetical protein BN874_1390021 [Candidatus Contendobacter odensis Run_B_J11]|uniref:Uncharacterized protein n=1 Tax=Candidatus Contendobacter odensis Run_B_J11 TaxID=1400861 RepID=A0A7U7G9D5_9GAMM|nr:hypothetical protein BN874_1390021 [Candidatus Contendobacter odensis Run_B_J11]
MQRFEPAGLSIGVVELMLHFRHTAPAPRMRCEPEFKLKSLLGIAGGELLYNRTLHLKTRDPIPCAPLHSIGFSSLAGYAAPRGR